MQIEILNLELNNYRQFVGKNEIKFSTNNKKNITFILAPNRSGKTTIIDSFRYLFYSKLKYGEGIANENLVKELNVGDEYQIKVAANIEYLNRVYTISRKSIVRKNTNRINFLDNFFNITYKDEDGVTKQCSENNANILMKEIMPENLFKYFFFEGEEIENLGDNLFNVNPKQNAFADAIRNILGFTYLYNMRDDLTKTVKKFSDDLANALDGDAENKKKALKRTNLLSEKEELKDTLTKNNNELEKIKELLKDVNKKLLDNALTQEKTKTTQHKTN